MSNNQKAVNLNPSIDIINRQSFDDRICDDLCEVVLQFLPFNDKIRLQCVSKQFQRSIFEKLLYLQISPFGLNLKTIESVLKKCPNIEFIDMRDKHFSRNPAKVEYNLIIDWIIRYCNHLNVFYGYFDLMIDTNKVKFIQKFGSKLKKTYFFDTSVGNVLKEIPNIKELNLTKHKWNLHYIFNVGFKRLKRVKLLFDTTVDQCVISEFPTFIKMNPFIEDLCIKCITGDEINEILIFSHISGLKNLLKLKIKSAFNLNLFEKSLKKMAVNCPKLKTIIFYYYMNYVDNPSINHLLSILKLFKQLRALKIQLDYYENYYIDNFSFKLFKGFENLTHLSIELCYPEDDIYDTILEDIDINLPKLKYLSLNNANFIATEWTHIILRRLSALHTIILNISNDNIRDIIKTKLIENKKLKTIKLTNPYIED